MLIAGSSTIDKAYEIDKLGKVLDWINLMTYDLHGKWEKQTGHHSALEGDKGDKLTVSYATEYWIKNGMPASKISLGMATYGRAFKLADPQNNGLGAPTSAVGDPPAGSYTRESGFMSYYEICTKSLTVVSANKALTPYGYSGDFWIGFEDPDSLKLKVDYLKMKGLRGAMFWAVDLDDFQNVCGQGKYPLLSAVDKVLSNGEVPPSTQAPIKTTNAPPVTDKPTDKPTNPSTQQPATKTNAPCQTSKPSTAPTNPPSQRPTGSGGCHPVGVWANSPGMKKWCVTNCGRGYCPPDYCKCV